jgi:hypothetical protein
MIALIIKRRIKYSLLYSFPIIYIRRIKNKIIRHYRCRRSRYGYYIWARMMNIRDIRNHRILSENESVLNRIACDSHRTPEELSKLLGAKYGAISYKSTH